MARMTVRILCFLLVMLLSIAVYPVSSQQNAVVTQACPDYGALQSRITCGYLSVPENYDHPRGAQIQLAFVILHHPSENPAPDPIIFLHGGPGNHTLARLDTLLRSRYVPVLAAGRDILIFDQRGTGRSHPALECPAYERSSGTHFNRDQQLDHLVNCGAALAEQHDLNAYNSVHSAADVDALRRAFGYEQVNLWAISYGTRIALEVLRHYPTTVRSVVLDSVYPPDVDLLATHPIHFDRALSRLFTACETDPRCSETFPRLSGQLFETVAHLAENPIRLSEPFDLFQLDGSSLLDVMFQMLYSTRFLGQIPETVSAAAQGDYSGYQQFLMIRDGQGQAISSGAYYGAFCAEQIPFTDWGQRDENWRIRPQFAPYSRSGWSEQDYRHICQAFDVQPSQITAPIVSDVPTLLLAGLYDPVTPVEWAERVSGTLDRSRVITLPATGHGATGSSGCAQNLLVSFVKNPDPAAVDIACTEELRLRFSGLLPVNPLDPVLPDSAHEPIAVQSPW